MNREETERERATRDLMRALLPMLTHVTEQGRLELEECLDTYVKAWIEELHYERRRGDW
jgi:hypothetical protein